MKNATARAVMGRVYPHAATYAFVAMIPIVAVACSDAENTSQDQRVSSVHQALYSPSECSADPAICTAVAKHATKYNLPRWFYYAIIKRESSFNRCSVNPNDQGKGIAQLTGDKDLGTPFPMYLATPDNGHQGWRNDMGLGSASAMYVGDWINMASVSQMGTARFSTQVACEAALPLGPGTDAFDPDANLDRFSSGYAAPAYYLFRTHGETPERTLRKVAYHWNKGLWGYQNRNRPQGDDPSPEDVSPIYLPQYDSYVATFKPLVEADDGVWTGPPCLPPYADSGCSSAAYPAHQRWNVALFANEQPIAAASWGANRIDLFFEDRDLGVLNTEYWNGLAWVGPEELDTTGMPLTSPPAAVAAGNGELRVFVRGDQGQVLMKSRTAGTWQPSSGVGYYSLGSPGNAGIEGAITAVYDGEWTHVFVHDVNGVLYSTGVDSSGNGHPWGSCKESCVRGLHREERPPCRSRRACMRA